MIDLYELFDEDTSIGREILSNIEMAISGTTSVGMKSLGAFAYINASKDAHYINNLNRTDVRSEMISCLERFNMHDDDAFYEIDKYLNISCKEVRSQE